MKKLFHHMQLILLFTFIWIVLNEKFGLIQIATGIVVSMVTIVFSNKFLLLDDYKKTYTMSPIVLIKYFLYLFIHIYKSGFSSIYKVIRGEGEVGISKYKTKITNEIHICMLANAITLTPGTVTIDKEGQQLIILHLENSNHCVPKIFEDILKEEAK